MEDKLKEIIDKIVREEIMNEKTITVNNDQITADDQIGNGIGIYQPHK
jgi:hypothetical protein